MKTSILFFAFLLFTISIHSQTSQTILGTWQNKEDATKVIEFYETSELKIFGRDISYEKSQKIIMKDLVYDASKKVYSGMMSPPDKDIKLNATISFISKDELKIVVKKFLLKKTIYLNRISNSN